MDCLTTLAQTMPSNGLVLGKEQLGPLYALKVDEQCLTIDPAENEIVDLDSLEVSSIRSIDVLKGDQATKEYGIKASKGVVVIYFKELESLSDELKAKFKLCK